MEKLESRPNIGKSLAARLQEAGIQNYNDLRLLGSKKAFIRLRTINQKACLNQLYALEGCIRNVRFNKLSEETKFDLRHFYKFIDRYME